MHEDETIDRGQLLDLTSQIVAAHVSHNHVSAADLPDAIRSVFDKLSELSVDPEEPAEEMFPAVPIKRSVKDDHIVCLEDGKKFKTLKRHLRTKYDLSPDEYRAKWGLPYDYPMVAPAYA